METFNIAYDGDRENRKAYGTSPVSYMDMINNDVQATES